MPVSIVVPQLGESIAEGTISKWLKAVGDSVRRDEPVVEIMTDKITVEVPSPAEGTMGSIVVQEGQTVPVGVEIATILRPGETAGEPAVAGAGAKAQPAAAAATTTTVPSAPRPAPAPAAQATSIPGPPRTSNGDGRPGFLSPIVRRLAREHGIDPSRVRGTGRGGRITREDMMAFIDQAKTSPAAMATPGLAPARLTRPATGPREELVALTGVRKVISERMTKSKFTAVHCTTFEEVEISAIVRLREEYKRRHEEQTGVHLTFTPFFVKAAVIALREFPNLNANWQGNDAVVVRRDYHIGVAVGRDEGLVVPVVKDADSKDLLEIARSVNDLSARAHAGRLTPDDLQGGTFSITNAGIFGSFASTPIINYPEVAILGVHKIVERPVVVDGQIVIRPMTNLALTFDHRWIDGHTAVQFIVRLKEILERPERLWFTV